MASLPLLLLMVAGALSAPYLKEFEEEIVALDSTCNNDVMRFSSSKTTVFDYVGETQNGIPGATENKNGLRITGTVYIKPIKKCIYSMQITKAELAAKSKTTRGFQRAAESSRFAAELEAQELFFRIDSGEIEAILTTVSEQPHVLNIKRGILSALQLGNTRVQTSEVDINGICDVKFEEYGDEITKTKNLSNCREHTQTELGFQSTAFQKTDLTFGLLNSTSKCVFSVSNTGRILSSRCTENHLLRPFSAGYESESGAKTTTFQSLVFMEEIDVDISAQLTNSMSSLQEETLLFSFERDDAKPVNRIVDRIDAIMRSLVDQSDKFNLAVKQGYAHEFTQLVSLLRKLDRKRMTPVWDKYFDCSKSRICLPTDDDLREVYKQYLLDALTYCGTPTCVYMVHNVIIDEVVTGERMNMFLQGIALVAKPTRAMIRDIHNIALKIPSRQAFLTLGTLMYRYCAANPEECVYEKTNPVTQAELFLESKLGQRCEGQENDTRVEELIRVLKAIGNSGRPGRLWSTLLQCARRSMHQNVSIAALEAMRRMPCDQERIIALHDTLEDINTDPEVRIHSFLALMKCPQRETLAKLVRQLETEPSRQVGSFMWSHLQGVLDSSDPSHESCKKHLKEILGGKPLRVPELDITKYSRSYEGSLHSKMFKSGLTTEGHVIFHPESFLPRSGLLNLTANVMGLPLNVLEMAIRVEGLETILAQVFGPNGIMPDNAIVKLFNISITKDDFEKVERSRNRRNVRQGDIENNIDEVHAQVNKRPVQPSGHLSVKMFGHEVRLLSYDDIFWMIDQVDEMNVIQLLMNLAKGGHKTFTKSFLFLETSQTVPTGLGLPLKLKLTGSAVASLELDGKFDIRNMFWGPSKMEMNGFVRPSAVAEISGQMGVESHFINTGMMIRSNVFTSQMIKGGIVFKEGQILKVNIDAPQEPVTLFNVSTTPFLFVNEEIDLVKGVARRISPDFCLNDTIISGLGLCTSFAVPVAFREYEAPYFPLSGPAHYGMKLIKADKKLTTYQLLIKKEKVEEGNEGKETIGSFEIGTPGATYSRRIGGMVRYIDSPKNKRLTIGTMQGSKRTNLYLTYNTKTNRMEAELESNMISSDMMSANIIFFNDTTKLNRHIGVSFGAKYGSFKVGQVLKLVTSETTYKLHSRTTYLPGKHLTGEVVFTPSTKSVNVRFDSTQFDQSIDLMGKIVNTDLSKGLDFSVVHPRSGKRGSLFIGLERDDASKKLIVKGAIEEKTASLSLGLYNVQDGRDLRLIGEVMGKSVELYSTYTAETRENAISTLSFGARYGDKVAETRFTYNVSPDEVTRQLCSMMVYGSKKLGSTCFVFDSYPVTSQGTTTKRASFVIRSMQQEAMVTFDYEVMSDKYSFTTTLFFNGKSMGQNSWQLSYKDIANAELKMITKVKNCENVVRWYSASKNDDVVFGFEVKGMGNRMALTATYSKQMKADAVLYGVLFEAFVNKKLPADYFVVLESGSKGYGISSTVTVMKYKMRSSVMLAEPATGEYALITNGEVVRDDLVMLGLKIDGLLIWTKDVKSYKEMYRLTVWGKQFNCGWKLGYRQSTGQRSERTHELQYDIIYGKDKSIKFVTTVLNSKEMFEVFLTTHFLKNRQVTQSFVYNKIERAINVDIEFLPQMFVRFLARLDKYQGWKVTTRVNFDWKSVNKQIEWFVNYKNMQDMKKLEFHLDFFKIIGAVEVRYEPEIKRLTMTTSLPFKRLSSIVLVASRDQVSGVSSVSLSTRNSLKNTMYTWLEGRLYETDRMLGFEILGASKSLLKSTLVIEKSNNAAYLDITMMGREVLRAHGKYLPEPGVHFNVFSGQKQLLSIIFSLNRDENTALLVLDAMRKNMNVIFAGKYDPLAKSVSLNVEIAKVVAGVMIRADYVNYIVGVDYLYENKLSGLRRVMGWQAMVDPLKKALIYNVTFSPSLSFQTVLEVQEDHIIKATLQRKIGQKVLNESSFAYDLRATESNLIFQWNKETLKAISEAVKPILYIGKQNVVSLLKEATKTTETLATLGKELSQKTLVRARSLVLTGATILDERFDHFDFKSAKDSLGELIVKLGKQTASLSKKILLIVSDYSLVAQDRIPALVEKILTSRDEITETIKLIIGVCQNITSSATPVLETAVELVKEFKIREKSVQEIVNLVISYIQQVSKYSLQRVKFITKERIPEIIREVRQAKIPFREETVEEAAKFVMEKVRSSTFDYDVKKTMEFIKTEVLKLKLMEKTVEEHLDLLIQEAKKLPYLSKGAMLKAISLGRVYVKEIDELTSELQEFLAPLTHLAKSLKHSVMKHYSPLVRKLVADIKTQLITLYNPLPELVREYNRVLVDFVGPLGRPYKKALDSIMHQLKDIRLVGKAIGNRVDVAVAKLNSELDKAVQDTNLYLNKVQNWYKTIAEKVSKMTAEDMVDAGFKTAEESLVKSVQILKDVMEKRMALYDQSRARLQFAVEQFKNMITTMKQYSMRDIDAMVENNIYKTAEILTKILNEVSSIATQLADLDLETPLGQAWEEADVMNHLEKYGINTKVATAIRKLKEYNLTEIVETGFASVRLTAEELVETSKKAVAAVMTYAKSLNEVMSYIRSIPKKDFETFYAEVIEALAKYQETALSGLSKRYERMAAKANKMYYNGAQMMEEYYKSYSVPMKNMYADLKERTEFVYNDVKDEAVKVYEHYKTYTMERMEAHVAKVRVMLLNKYREAYNKLVMTVKKYEDMTVEQVGQIVFAKTTETYVKVAEQSVILREKMKVIVAKILALSKKIYKDLEQQATVYYQEFELYVMPQVIAKYEKLYSDAVEMTKKGYSNVVAVYDKAYSMVDTWYEDNKQKTIEQFYLEGEEFAEMMYEKYSKQLMKKARELKFKAKGLILNVVVPEVKKELESIFNQTLRASVVLGNKTVECFAPHFRIIKEQLIESMSMTKDYSTALYDNSKTTIEMRLKQLVRFVLELIKKIRQHPLYTKYGTMISEHKLTKTAIYHYKKTLLNLDEQYQELIRTVKELLKHETVLKLKKTIKEYSSRPEVDQVFSTLRQINESAMYTLEQLYPKIDAWLQETKKTLKSMPESVKSQAIYFRQNPEECFWTNYKSVVELGKTVMNMKWREFAEDKRNDLIGLMIEVTDLKTKEVAMDAVQTVLEYYKKLRTVPETVKGRYIALSAEYKAKLEKSIRLVKQMWRESAVHPIITHDVWSEIFDEIKTHELVEGFYGLVREVLDEVMIYGEEIKETLQKTKAQWEAQIKGEYEKAIKTVKKFVKETTLEDIVTYVKDSSADVRRTLMIKRVQIEEEIRKQYATLKAALEKYRALAKVEIEKYTVKAKALIKEWKPKVLATYDRVSEKQKMYREKAMQWAQVQREMLKQRLITLWKESGITKKYNAFIKMTIRELIDEAWQVPDMVLERVEEYKRVALDKYSEYMDRAQRSIQPYTSPVVYGAKWLANEVTETAVFVNRYYRVNEKVIDLKDRVMLHGKMMSMNLPKYMKSALKRGSKSGLRLLHSSLVYIDGLDFSKAREYLETLSADAKAIVDKFVKVDTTSMKITIVIPHYTPVTPSFSYQIEKLNSTVRSVANRSIESAKELIESMKRRTEEIRRDLSASYDVGKRLAQAGFRSARQYQGDAVEMVRELGQEVIEEGRELSEEVYESGHALYERTVEFATEIVDDIAESEDLTEAYAKIVSYGVSISKIATNVTLERFEVLKKMLERYHGILLEESSRRALDLKPYISLVKAALDEVKQGKDVNTAFRHVLAQVRKTYRQIVTASYKRYLKFLKFIEIEDAELKAVLREFRGTHGQIARKYYQRIHGVYRFAKVMVDRALRIAKVKGGRMAKRPVRDPLGSSAMIFGKLNVMTFDGKIYETPAYSRDTCTYVLARDFHNGNFTVLSQKEKLIIMTPDMSVSIDRKGEVKSTVTIMSKGRTIKKETVGLPIEGASGKCMRRGPFVRCRFNMGLTVKCDVDHYLCRITLAGWHYGKTEGLLGSNNNEPYDDFRQSNGYITTSVQDFVQSWEVSGDPACKLSQGNVNVPACNRAPSLMCQKVFKSKASPLREYFGIVSPAKFLSACEIESAACDNLQPVEISHCNTTAAYIEALKTKGERVEQLSECASYMGHREHETWTVSPKRELDVVVMMSQRSSAQSKSKTVASLLFNLHRNHLVGYNARYALIGFGGQGVHEFPHIHSSRGQIFMNEYDVATIIKEMPYNGMVNNSNDAYEAIRRASELKFRPEASRIFLLFNSDVQTSHIYGPTIDETEYAIVGEADAALYVFDQINFKNVGLKGKIFGQTTRKIYVAPEYRVASTIVEFPNGPFKPLVSKTRGGMFSNKLKPSQLKLLVTGLADSLSDTLREHSQFCKACTLRVRYYGSGIPVCTRDSRRRC